MGDELTSVRRARFRPASPSARDLVAVFFRQRRALVCSFLVVFLGSIAWAVMTRSYTAEMQILLRRSRLDLPVSAGPSAAPARYDVSDEEVNSEAELLKNRETLRRVASANRLDAKLGWRPWRNTPEARLQRATSQLAGSLKVQPVRKTRLLKVRYHASDPELSARVLSSLAAIYLEKHSAVQRPSGGVAFFDQLVGEHEARLVASERKLLMLSDEGAVAPELQRDLAIQKFTEAENNLKQLAIAISETESRIRALRNDLQSLPERTTMQIRTADNPQLMEKMKSTLLTLQLRRTELLTRFQPNYRLVQEVEKQISETQAAIAAEQLSPLRDETTGRAQQFEWAKSELEKSQIELQALQARFGAARIVVADYGSLARKLGRDSIAHKALLRDNRADEESYLLLVRKREEARLGDAMDRGGILNAVVVQPPVVPTSPGRPMLAFVVIGLFTACLVSTGVAFTWDALDGTFRTPEEVKHILGSPVIACLPQTGRVDHFPSGLSA